MPPKKPTVGATNYCGGNDTAQLLALCLFSKQYAGTNDRSSINWIGEPRKTMLKFPQQSSNFLLLERWFTNKDDTIIEPSVAIQAVNSIEHPTLDSNMTASQDIGLSNAPLLDKIDKLRDFNIGQHVPLPQVRPED